MSIEMISFVGIDERTDLQELKNLASLSSVKLEFGILYSETKKSNRYPPRRILDDFAAMYNSNTQYSKSIHLCGSSVDKFLNCNDMFLETVFGNMDYWNVFDAVQLNFTLTNEENIPQILQKTINTYH